jgi:hypothetical protein
MQADPFAELEFRNHAMKTTPLCLECRQPLTWGVHEFSQRIYGHSLCLKDQYLLEESGATAQAVDLYLALKEKNFPLVLEYYDGHKQVDMAIPGKLYIEVNGPYHQANRQAMTDLTRSVYSLEKKIPTIIIPNSLLDNPKTFVHAVEELSKACRVMLGHTSVLSIVHGIKAVQLQ